MPATRIIDISTPLDAETPSYAGDPVFTRTVVSAIAADGSGYNLSALAMSAHTGTHIDAPAHFLAEGKTIDQVPARRWVTPAVVIDLPHPGPIHPSQLERRGIRAGDAVLLRANARRAADAGPDDFSALTRDAAELLVAKKINLVGIDALSIESYLDADFPVHRKLLRNDVLIIEGLRLAHVRPGRYTLVATPLLIRGGDGAPARALLIARS
ncbi:MAG: cyclase family protein [Bacteroidota bacterium]|nr:cyclase family protein [Bacteroidota bacterium]